MNTKERNRRGSMIPSYWRNPVERFFGNDLMNLWNGDVLETVPAVNISEDEKSFKVEMAAPGLKKEDFNISVEGNVLTISSEKETEREEGGEKENYSRREYNYSSFARSLSLPENADGEQVSAKYTDGVLRLTIAKKKQGNGNSGKKVNVE